MRICRCLLALAALVFSQIATARAAEQVDLLLALAMAVALEPAIVTGQSEHYVDVETESELTRGMTVVDRLNVAGDERNRELWRWAVEGGKKAKIFWTIDNSRWKHALYEALK